MIRLSTPHPKMHESAQTTRVHMLNASLLTGNGGGAVLALASKIAQTTAVDSANGAGGKERREND